MEEQELRLIEGLRNGDEHAYHELFVHHYEVLCHVALQIVGDAFLAESLIPLPIFGKSVSRSKSVLCYEPI